MKDPWTWTIPIVKVGTPVKLITSKSKKRLKNLAHLTMKELNFAAKVSHGKVMPLFDITEHKAVVCLMLRTQILGFKRPGPGPH